MTNLIMLVEGETVVAMDIMHRLESLGYQVEDKAVTGEQAVHLARELTPELILMDVKLSGEIDGIEAATRIRSFSDVPIIYLTSLADDQALERARPTGAYGYLLKPFEDIELRCTIEMALYKHKIECKLRESEERYSLVVRAANDGIWDWNLRTNLIYYSPRWKEMIGYKENEIGNDPIEWFKRVHPDDQKQVQTELVSHLNGSTPQFECEYRIQESNGRYLWVLSRGLAMRGAQDKPDRIAGSQSDISARKIAEERLAYDALHDTLTGLPNRALFLDRLENRMAQTKRNPQNLFALIYIDLDRFKVVNDSLGHAVGDQLLITVAQRLKKCLRPEDTVSRLGGDEFAILLNEVKESADAIQATNRMMAGLMATTMLGTVERFPTASFGIAMFNSGYKNPGELLRDADSAMYRAKALGRNRYQLFDESMHQRAIELITLEGELKRGIERREFQLAYQPIFSLVSGELVGVEALVRWQHPKRGVLLPLEFIHVAEDTSLIIPIGEFVLRTACTQAKAWRDAGRSTLWVSVNLSARQFQGQNLVEVIRQTLTESGLPGDGLRLEITESVAIRDMDYTIRILNALNKLGVSTLLDDFGTGYSSLHYLKHFPFKSLKIDQSFIQDVHINQKSESLTKAIISMARSLEMEVVAEGVETNEQLSFLRLQLCENVQGFLLSRPIPADEMDQVLNINK